MKADFEQTTSAVLHTCDAVVVGASFGGISAAVEMARRGLRVAVVEPRTYPGRELTATLRPWLQVGDTQTLPDLIAASIQAAGRQQRANEAVFNLDALKIHLEDTLLEAGVKLLYASLVVGLQTHSGALTGVIIGGKSGRQVIRCRLVLDTSETALLARLSGESFEDAPSGSTPCKRTLEFDNMGAGLELETPLTAAGLQASLHPGCRNQGHVLVECDLTLPFPTGDAFTLSARETLARHQTMAFVAELARQNPAFESAYLSGASYELYGQHITRLVPPAIRPEWTQGLPDLTGLDRPSSPADFAGSIRGLWYLNEAVPLSHYLPQQFYDPIFTSYTGAALARCLCQHREQVSAPQPAGEAAVINSPVQPASLHIREPHSPQRGYPYTRTAAAPMRLTAARDVDVLVVGGGTSGATAAITAAREGVRTVLIEMNPGLGGTGTYGGVHSYWFGRRVGFSANVIKLVEDMHLYLHHPQPKGLIPKWNIEAKAYALLKEAEAQGVEILFNAAVIGALMEGSAVRGVVVATRTGPAIIRARVVIDASGDGDVAAFAGADVVYGSERDHVTMWYALAQFTRPGLTRNHFTSTVDVSNVEDYTRAILAGRRRGRDGDMHDHGIYVAPRESRHIRADIVLTLTDQLRQRRWEDVINVAFSNHDVKGHTGSDWLRIGLIPPNLEIEIPYRALLPHRLDNLLVVGKAISATHDALPAIRMQADLENLGGAAALAAALAVRDDRGLREIDIRALQTRLVAAASLPADVLTRSLRPLDYSEADLRRMIEALSADKPLYAYSDMELTDLYDERIPLVEICCAGPQVIPLLEHALTHADGSRRILLAQALALVGSRRAVPALVEAIESRLQGDMLPSRSAHIRYTQLPPDHGAMPDVVYLLYSLGMVPDKRALPVWRHVINRLALTIEADFYDEMKGVFYYVDAVCFAAERLAHAEMISALRQLHGCPAFHSKASYEGFQPDHVLERLAYLELVIGRALARCGSADGLVILISYLHDSRALLAEHAHSELTAITGQDFGKDAAAWSRWLEFHGDDIPAKPWIQPGEPVQAWAEVMLTDEA